jgi:hypothetical protein
MSLTLLALAAVIVIFFFVIRSLLKRGEASVLGEQLARIASNLGFTSGPAENEFLAQRLKLANAGSRDRGVIRSLYQRQESSFEMYLCEYDSWSLRPGGSSMYQVIISVVSSLLNLPRLSLQGAPHLKGAVGSLATKVLSAAVPAPMVKLSFDQRQFKGRFLVYAKEDHISVREVAESIMDSLGDRDNVSVDAYEDTLLVTSPDLRIDMLHRKVDLPEVNRVFEVARDLYERLRRR